MDAITLDLRVRCIVGILDRERIQEQDLEISLRMALDLGPCGETGDLTRSVDYAAVDSGIRQLCIEGRFLLIETLGLAILRQVLVGPVTRARVRIAKPQILVDTVPAVEMERDRAWAEVTLSS